MHLKIKPNNYLIRSMYENHGSYHEDDCGLDLFTPESIIIPFVDAPTSTGPFVLTNRNLPLPALTSIPTEYSTKPSCKNLIELLLEAALPTCTNELLEDVVTVPSVIDNFCKGLCKVTLI